MIDPKNIEYINSLGSNFRSDVIVAGMVDNGIEADKIVILRRRGRERETDKEIVDVEYKQDYEGKGDDALLIRSNRKGIYDTLPEGIFHNSAGSKDSSQESIVHSFRKQSKQELFIRRFFSLYEAEAERARVDIQLAELRYDRPGKHRTFVDTMSGLWPMVKDMDAKTAMLFIRTVPYISDIRGSYTQIAQAVSLITGYSVGIELVTVTKMPETKGVRLGAMKLGVNSVLRGKLSAICAKVIVTPSARELKDVVWGGRYKVLKRLLDVFMPFSIDYQICVKAKQADCTARLGDKKLPCILGVNARLKSKDINRYESKE